MLLIPCNTLNYSQNVQIHALNWYLECYDEVNVLIGNHV